jgi:two-component sensor histidine kinase
MRNLVDLDNQITMTEDLLAFIKRTFTDGSPQVRETQTRLEALQRMRDELADRIARAH